MNPNIEVLRNTESDNPADTSRLIQEGEAHDELSDFELEMVAAGGPAQCENKL